MQPVRSSTWAMSSTRYSLVADVCGRPLKCTAMGTAPRRAMRQVATGLSMPLDSRVTILPLLPTGRPPTPGKLRAYT